MSDRTGNQNLIINGATLTDVNGSISGHAIVFDEITALIKGQRDAAWSEMARRLAHEIKNSLTPIQLAAERLRHKYLARMDSDDADMFDRMHEHNHTTSRNNEGHGQRFFRLCQIA